jgi:hypothetical protein
MTEKPVNDNQHPIVVLHPTGDGISLARTLARVLVRRELMFATEIADAVDCENVSAAG